MTSDRKNRHEVYQDDAGEWRWRSVAPNGRIVACSGEGFVSKYNAERSLAAERGTVGPTDPGD